MHYCHRLPKRTNLGNQKMATDAGTTTLTLQKIQNSAKIYFMITMVKGHRYHKYGHSDAQLNWKTGGGCWESGEAILALSKSQTMLAIDWGVNYIKNKGTWLEPYIWPFISRAGIDICQTQFVTKRVQLKSLVPVIGLSVEFVQCSCGMLLRSFSGFLLRAFHVHTT